MFAFKTCHFSSSFVSFGAPCTVCQSIYSSVHQSDQKVNRNLHYRPNFGCGVLDSNQGSSAYETDEIGHFSNPQQLFPTIVTFIYTTVNNFLQLFHNMVENHHRMFDFADLVEADTEDTRCCFRCLDGLVKSAKSNTLSSVCNRAEIIPSSTSTFVGLSKQAATP